MKRERSRTLLLLAALSASLALLAGCAAAAPAPGPTASPAPSTTATFTALPATPTLTASPAPSVTATLTRTPAPTPAATPTAQAALEQAKVTQIRNQVGGVLVTLQVPGLNSLYNIILAGVRYSCSLDPKYPENLFCWGLAQPPFNKTINLTFLDPQTGAVLAEEKTFLAEANFPAPGQTFDNTANCANRGENQTCEVECRLDDEGNPCIVASCYDACGQTLSIQTCSSNLENISFCSAEQMQDIKKRYNIP